MTGLSKTIFALLCLALVSLAGCSSTKPLPYTGLSSAPQLQQNRQQDADKIPYAYAPDVNWRNYSALLMEPVAIYSGTDHQFGDLAEADKQELSKYMDKEFRKVLSQRFRIDKPSGAETLRLRLTLTGADTNTAVASTVTRFDLAGMPYNVVQSIRGKEGILMGSVSFAVEIYDASSNRLLKAFVSKQYPNAMNIAATFGSLNAAKTGIDKGAENLLDQLR